MKRVILITGVLLSMAFLSNAQDKHSEIESLRISVYTQKMGLTPAESKVFWPVYEEYKKEKDVVRHEKKGIWRRIRDQDETALSDEELEQLLDREKDLDVKEELVAKKYHTEFKKVLPIEKVARLYQAEYEFKRELIRRIGEKKD